MILPHGSWADPPQFHDMSFNFIPNPSPEIEFYPLIRPKIEFHPFIRKERYPLKAAKG